MLSERVRLLPSGLLELLLRILLRELLRIERILLLVLRLLRVGSLDLTDNDGPAVTRVRDQPFVWVPGRVSFFDEGKPLDAGFAIEPLRPFSDFDVVKTHGDSATPPVRVPSFDVAKDAGWGMQTRSGPVVERMRGERGKHVIYRWKRGHK
jgi:hypothetical protein